VSILLEAGSSLTVLSCTGDGMTLIVDDETGSFDDEEKGEECDTAAKRCRFVSIKVSEF